MKRLKNLIIASVSLAVLVGVYFLVTKVIVKNDGGKEETTEAETYVPAPVAPENLTGISISIAGDEGEEKRELSFKLKDDATGWLWTGDENVPLDNNAFASIVTALSGETSDVCLENATDAELASYGLDDPQCTAEFTFSDGSVQKYNIGAYNGFNKRYYFSEASAPRTVYMVSGSALSALDLTIKDMLLWDEVPSVSSASVTSLSFEKDGKKLVYTYYPHGKSSDYTDSFNWYLSVDGGEEIRVDSGVANEIMEVVTSLGFYDCVWFTGERPEGAFGLDAATVMTISYNRTDTVSDSTTGTSKEVTVPATFTLSIGGFDPESRLYASTDSSVLVYTLYDSDLISKIMKADLHDIMPERVENINFALVDGIDLAFGEKKTTITLTHDATGSDDVDYTDSLGRKIEAADFDAFREKLASLTALSFTDRTEAASGSGETLFTATFTFDTEGTEPQTLLITTYADGLCRASFAGRDDQLVSREAVDALLEAAAAIAG